MLKYSIVLLFGLIFNLKLEAQTHYNFEPIVGKSSGERRIYFSKTYPSIIEAGDSVHQSKSQEFIKQYKAFANKVNDKDIVVDADYAEVYNRIQNKQKPNLVDIKTIDSLYEYANKENIVWLKINCKWFNGMRCFNQHKLYEKGFLYFKELEDLLAFINIEDFPDKQWMLYNLSDNYMLFHDYASAIRNAKKGIECNQEPNVTTFRLYNNIGISFQKQKLYDSAIIYFNKGLNYNYTNFPEERAWQSIMKGNIGECLLELGKFDEAYPYVEIDIANAEALQDLPLAANAYMNKAAIEMHRQNAESAKTILDKAYKYLQISKSYKRLEKLYPLMSECAKLQGHSALAVSYLDSALIFKDSNNKEFNAMQILRGEQQRNLKKEDQLNLESKKNLRERNLLFVFIIASGVFAIYIYRLQKKKQQQQQQVFELELAKKEAELKQAEAELELFAIKISENLNKINQLEQHKELEDKSELLSNLQQSTILTEDEWQQFKIAFDKVHKGFLIRLKESLPNLSPAETRFIALAKLRFNSKEMANALGISAQSVRVTWHRLRKKLNLSEEGTLDDFVDGL